MTQFVLGGDRAPNPRRWGFGRLPHAGVPEIVSRPKPPLCWRGWENTDRGENCLRLRLAPTPSLAQWPVGVGADFWYSSMRHPPLPATVLGAKAIHAVGSHKLPRVVRNDGYMLDIDSLTWVTTWRVTNFDSCQRLFDKRWRQFLHASAVRWAWPLKARPASAS